MLFEKACYKAALGMWGMRCAALQQGFEDLRQKAIYLSNLSHPLLKVRYGLMSHTTVFMIDLAHRELRMRHGLGWSGPLPDGCPPLRVQSKAFTPAAVAHREQSLGDSW